MIALLASMAVTVALAANLDYSDRSLLFTDAPFKPAERAGVSLLHGIGAVQGNDDGTFRPNRSINRAEFVKIALNIHPRIRISASDAARCFPDVQQDQWFAPFVCTAKSRGMVKGYTDGTFRPEQGVTYAEAVKIVMELFNYQVGSPARGEQWYEPYMIVAGNQDLLLPLTLRANQNITRGQMARLGARFRAAYEGELDLYKRAEVDLDGLLVDLEKEEMEEQEMAAEEESNASEESNDSNEIETETSDTGDPQVITRPDTPTTNLFLLLGERHGPIASGTIHTPDEQTTVRFAEFTLRREARSFKSLYLVTGEGKEIGELSLQKGNTDRDKWVGDFGTGVTLPPNSTVTLAFEVGMRTREDGGFSQDLVRAQRASVTLQSTTGNDSYQRVIENFLFPYHQSVQAVLSSVSREGESIDELTQDDGHVLGEFVFRGEGELFIEQLTFTPQFSRGVKVEKWFVRRRGGSLVSPCTTDNDGNINCTRIPQQLSELQGGSAVIELIGDVTFTMEGPHVFQVHLEPRGSVGTAGAVWWNDHTGSFRWLPLDMEEDGRIASGTQYRGQ